MASKVVGRFFDEHMAEVDDTFLQDLKIPTYLQRMIKISEIIAFSKVKRRHVPR